MIMKPVSEIQIRHNGSLYLTFQSEQDPGACMMLVELAKEAGLPDGVVNCIHGQHEGNQKQSLIYLSLLF